MLRPEDCIPGTLVECIDAKPRGGRPAVLVRRRMYTITGSALAKRPWCENPLAVSLAEVPDLPGTVGFAAVRFRRVPDERLEVFRKLLAPTPKQTEPA